MSILRLPDEILCKAFAFAVPSSYPPLLSSYVGISYLDSICPNNVSTVCRHWREVVLGDPSIWATIYIWLQHPSEEILKKAVIHLEQCLERSRNIPLSCFITCVVKYDLSSIHLAGLLFCLLLEQQYRWREVEINIPGALSNYADRIDRSLYFVLRANDLRLLQSFSTNFPHMFRIFGPHHLSSLTSLEFGDIFHPNTDMFLARSPNLEKLVMRGHGKLQGVIPNRPILLDRLRTLCYDAPLSGLQTLDCPALEDVTITYYRSRMDVHHYHNFLTRNPPSRVLRLQAIPSLSYEQFRDLLPPSELEIKSLTLSFSTPDIPLPDYSVFEVLSERRAISSSDHSGRFKFVHELEHLEVVGAESSTIESTLNFLTARWTTNDRRLASVKLKQCVDFVQDRCFVDVVTDTGALPAAWSQVKSFTEEGLVLEIS